MKHSLILITLFISISYNVFAQNWFPMEVGNRYHYYFLSSDGSSAGSTTMEIVGDTIIDNNRFFDFSAVLHGLYYFDVIEQKIYARSNGGDTTGLFMDFNLSAGEMLYQYVPNHAPDYRWVEIVEEVHILWDSVYSAKGYEHDAPHWWDYDKKVWALNIGLSSDAIVQAIINDSTGVHIYDHNHYPIISFDPDTVTHSPFIEFSVNVNHEFNIFNCPGCPFQFVYVSSILIEHFYYYEFNSDTIYLTTQSMEPYFVSGFDYIRTVYLDTALLKSGWTYNYRIVAKDRGMITHTTYSPDTGYYSVTYEPLTDVVNDEGNTVNIYSLSQNYPNPFNPTTTIKYGIPAVTSRKAQSEVFVTLKVYDVLGNEIATLVNEEKRTGSYEINFDGNELPSGIYFYIVQAGEFVETKKMVLMK